MERVVYTLSDPHTGAIRYVGKTCRGLKQRLKDHLLPKNLKARTHKNCWLKALAARGAKPVIEIVEVAGDGVDEAERFWISQFRALGFDLTNATDGGEGTTGLKRLPRTEAHRARLSAALKGRQMDAVWREKLGAALRGKPKKPFTPEHRANISAARRGHK